MCTFLWNVASLVERTRAWQQSPPHPRGSGPLEKRAPLSPFSTSYHVVCFHISLPIAIEIFYFDNYHFSGRELLSLKKKPFWGKKMFPVICYRFHPASNLMRTWILIKRHFRSTAVLLISVLGNSIVLDVSFKFLSYAGPLIYCQGNSFTKKRKQTQLLFIKWKLSEIKKMFIQTRSSTIPGKGQNFRLGGKTQRM